jgi:sec-independent protein translocase protein TatA
LDWTTIVAVGVLVVVLIWGPQKIPDLARSLGRARREFEEASRGISEPSSRGRADGTTQEPLVEVAQRLGINTQGKTRQEISDEIVKSASPQK